MALAHWICYFEPYMQPCMFRNELNQIHTVEIMNISGSEWPALICSITAHSVWTAKSGAARPHSWAAPGGVCCLPPLNTISCVFHSLIPPVSEKEKKIQLKKKGPRRHQHTSLKILLNLWLSLLSDNAESFVFQGFVDVIILIILHSLCGLKRRAPNLGTRINKHFRCVTFLWSVHIFLNELGDTFSTSARRTVAAGVCTQWSLNRPGWASWGLFIFDEEAHLPLDSRDRVTWWLKLKLIREQALQNMLN